MPYEYLEDLATADIAFRAWGKTPQAVFAAAAEAVMNVMVEDLDAIRPAEQRTIRLDHEAIDMLLFDFLQEIVYYKDAELLLLRVAEVHIDQDADRYRLSAEAAGETLDPARHEQRVDVKAITLHRFALEQTDRGWEATVILDI